MPASDAFRPPHTSDCRRPAARRARGGQRHRPGVGLLDRTAIRRTCPVASRRTVVCRFEDAVSLPRARRRGWRRPPCASTARRSGDGRRRGRAATGHRDSPGRQSRIRHARAAVRDRERRARTAGAGIRSSASTRAARASRSRRASSTRRRLPRAGWAAVRHEPIRRRRVRVSATGRGDTVRHRGRRRVRPGVRDGTARMFVGDRSGTIFRVAPAEQPAVLATLPASVAAYHLAVGPDGWVYVSVPTLVVMRPIYRVSTEGASRSLTTAFGRPQGLAFDAAGIAPRRRSAGRASGVYRLEERSRARAGRSPARGSSASRSIRTARLVVASNDTAILAFGNRCRPHASATRASLRICRDDDARHALFRRKPIADLIVDEESPRSLKRVLGAGDLDHAGDRRGDRRRHLRRDRHRGRGAGGARRRQ